MAYCVRMQSWRWVFAVMLAACSARAQWEILPSGGTADLRGIHAVGNGVAWASGTQGTVLRTTDDGKSWVRCSTPPGAEGVDFRGVQAFDASTAIVMSSGKGDLSRLYKTENGCKTWKLVFTNPDKDGFWDAVVATRDHGYLIGDPVDGRFVVFESTESGLETWERFGRKSCLTCPVFVDQVPIEGETLFAASNSVLEGDPSSNLVFVTGGKRVVLFHGTTWDVHRSYGNFTDWAQPVPLAKAESAGAFSLAGYGIEGNSKPRRHYVVVGGDYLKPDSTDGTSAISKDGGRHWAASKTPPHGYRSAVAYDEAIKTWITVGPNGTDVSTDDGRNWRALRPDAAAGDAADADQHWNALSLPFVVGPHGRIGKLRPAALIPAPQRAKP